MLFCAQIKARPEATEKRRSDSKEARFSCESLTFAANSRIAINQTWNQRIYLEWSAHFLRAKNSGITNWFKESCCRPYESPPPSESGNHQRRRSQTKHHSDFQIEHQHHPGNGSSNGGRDKTTFISPTNKSSKHQNRQVHVSKKTNQSLYPICTVLLIRDATVLLKSLADSTL